MGGSALSANGDFGAEQAKRASALKTAINGGAREGHERVATRRLRSKAAIVGEILFAVTGLEITHRDVRNLDSKEVGT